MLKRYFLQKNIDQLVSSYIRQLPAYQDVPWGLVCHRNYSVINDDIFRQGVIVTVRVDHVSVPYPPDSQHRPDWEYGLLMELRDHLIRCGYEVCNVMAGWRTIGIRVFN